ncbi:MAG TPA: PAS domain S-box protein [Gemmatimonadaceae bacterium]|nr:PAS domain S-box protein [Gemmatimonadaceae bacterium]
MGRDNGQRKSGTQRRGGVGPRRDPAGDAALARSIVEGLPDAVVVTSPDGVIIAANDAAARLFDTTLDTLIGRAIDAVLDADEERAVVATHERAALRGTPQQYRLRIPRAGGPPRTATVSTAVLLRAGERIGCVSTLRDVTEEAAAYETLALSESRYRHLLEGASDAILTLSAAGAFTSSNYAAEVISGYSRDELVGMFFPPLIVPEELEKVFGEFQRALWGERKQEQFETLFIRKDGTLRSIAVTASCIAKGEEVLCIVRDVTDQKALQQQLIQSEKMGAIGQLVSGVAHELNNPLASVAAFAQLVLADKTLPSGHRHSAEVIASEARRAARIVGNLLTFARQHKAEKVPADINRVLEETLELRVYELTVRGIQVERDFEPALPETMADVHQLKQVFLNLMTNAEQAMVGRERAHHRLTIRTRAATPLVRIEVEDTGPGVPPDSLERIFNPFYTTKPVGKGTGLGLSISLGIVSEHGGRIWAENIATGGSRFVVELPIVVPVRREARPATPPDAPPAGLRVLVADDEPSLREALSLWLRSQGHEVAMAASGAEALDLAARGAFDALLLDLRMPDVSGQEVFERLRRVQSALADRIIFITGDTVSTELRDFLGSTGRPFVAKPFDFDELTTVLAAQAGR